MIEIRSLVGVDFETMTSAFNDAFSDYDIPAQYTTEYLNNLVIRRGYRPELAVGAFGRTVEDSRPRLSGQRRAAVLHVMNRGGTCSRPGKTRLLAVRRDRRRRGIGRALLDAASAHVAKPLRIMNIDERAEEITRFLERCGAQRFVRQIEMVRSL